MGRNVYGKFETKPAPEAVVFPIVTPKYLPHGERVPGDKLPKGLKSWRENRAFSPYLPGEMILYVSSGKIMLGRVWLVLSHWMERREYFIPLYRVQYVTKKGCWSGNWVDVYPGFVTRAYFKEEEPIPRPETIDSLKQLLEMTV